MTITIPARLVAAAVLLAGLSGGLAASSAAQESELRCPAPEARGFDFWIGEWDVLNRNRRPEGVRFFETGTATDRVYAVVGGCGIVEHWRGDAIGRHIIGFSVRAYDPADGEWDIVLLWPTTGEPSFGVLRGTFRHGRGEFSFRRTTAAGDTIINRFTFSDIRPDALRWENGTSRDGGRSFTPGWIMEFTRRDPLLDGPLLNGPAVTTRRCPGSEHRTFDRWLGAWRGTRTAAAGDTTEVRVRLVPILEGCAVMEQAKSVDGSWEAFRVRAYEPAAERWTEYALSTDRPWLLRREARTAGAGDLIVFQDVAVDGGRLTRSTWAPTDAGLTITAETASEADGTWETASVIHLSDRLDAPYRP